jgi:hypothetical protein
MPKVLKKTEEKLSGFIVYNNDKENPDYDSFEIKVSGEIKDHIKIKHNTRWTTTSEAIRYFENLIKIIKEELQ